ncbi:adenosylcobinamide-GDP ribazoletransferase [Candidatus Bathyarchaeota archaeon]|nr:adenosylcobinamide-GDP ribazoletransferase [Candidatus Bathyarchaeota archaeon]
MRRQRVNVILFQFVGYDGKSTVKALTVFRGLMAFLTSIPVKMDESFLDISARYMFLFPVIGAIIGVLAGAYARFTNNVLFLLFGTINNVVFSGSYEVFFDFVAKGLAAAMTIAFLLVVIGLQHTDGLVDVGNALGIRKASLKEKVDIAHEWTVTRTGAVLAILVSFFTFLLIFLTKTDVVIQALIVAEVSAKLAMVTTGWQGISPPPRFYENRWEKGRNFIEHIKNKHGLYAISLTISLIVSIALLGFSSVLAVASGILVGGFMIFVGKQVFEGVNGDIFGATNEIARMVALFVLVIV